MIINRFLLVVLLCFFTVNCVQVVSKINHLPFIESESDGMLTTLKAESPTYSLQKGFPILHICLKNKGQKIKKLFVRNNILAKIEIAGETFNQDIIVPLSDYTVKSRIILRQDEDIVFDVKPKVNLNRISKNSVVKVTVTFPFIYTSPLCLILKNESME